MSIQKHPDFIAIDAEIDDMVACTTIAAKYDLDPEPVNTAYDIGYRDGLTAALRVLRKPVGIL